jgi:L-lysine exporter family protein LysE/ArgO
LGSIFFQGFIFGLAYVAPIGPQNLFVINSSINNNKIKYKLKIVLIVVFFDISLALACFIGVGVLFALLPVLKYVLLFLGSIIIIIIGIRTVFRKIDVECNDKTEELSLLKIIFFGFSLAWLNPQAVIDGTMILGGVRAALPVYSAYVFMAGVCFASAIWFGALSLLASNVIGKFKKALVFINAACGIILVLCGFRLGWELLSLLL